MPASPDAGRPWFCSAIAIHCLAAATTDIAGSEAHTARCQPLHRRHDPHPPRRCLLPRLACRWHPLRPHRLHHWHDVRGGHPLQCDAPADMWSRVDAGAAETSVCPTVDEANSQPALDFGGGIITAGPTTGGDAGDLCCYTLAFPCAQ